jgi:hypothetical protein
MPQSLYETIFFINCPPLNVCILIVINKMKAGETILDMQQYIDQTFLREFWRTKPIFPSFYSIIGFKKEPIQSPDLIANNVV